MFWFRTPYFLYPLLFKYLLSKILHYESSPVISNWIYFLRLTKHTDILFDKISADIVRITNRDFDHTVLVRIYSSDILVYIQIYYHGEYNSIKKLQFHNQPTIIDLGANVGFFSLWSVSIWNDAQILAIEPDPENFDQLNAQIQLNKLTNVKTANLAIWTKDQTVSLTRPEHSLNWSFKISENTQWNDTVEGLTLSSILARFGLVKIQLLKMDIEGAEFNLFQTESFLKELTNSVNHLIMETHHPDEQREIASQLRHIGFEIEIIRELILARNNNFMT